MPKPGSIFMQTVRVTFESIVFTVLPFDQKYSRVLEIQVLPLNELFSWPMRRQATEHVDFSSIHW